MFPRTIALSEHEFGLIVSGLRKIKVKLSRDLRRNREAGFKPAPGCVIVSDVRLKTLAHLMDRLGIDGKGDGQ